MSDERPQAVDPDAHTETWSEVDPRAQSRGPGNERTGVPAVDRILAEVESVGALPVAEHVEVFERAHEELRRALDVGPNTANSTPVKR